MIDGKIIVLRFDSDIYTPKIRHVNVGFRGMEGFTNDAIAIQGENSPTYRYVYMQNAALLHASVEENTKQVYLQNKLVTKTGQRSRSYQHVAMTRKYLARSGSVPLTWSTEPMELQRW